MMWPTQEVSPLASRSSKLLRHGILLMLCAFAFCFSVTAHAEDQTKLQLYVPENSESSQEAKATSAPGTSGSGKTTGSSAVATGDTNADWASTTLVHTRLNGASVNADLHVVK